MLHGCWIRQGRRIFIKESGDPERQLEALLHELAHDGDAQRGVLCNHEMIRQVSRSIARSIATHPRGRATIWPYFIRVVARLLGA